MILFRFAISHFNYCGQLGNDSLLGLIHEARIRFFDSMDNLTATTFRISSSAKPAVCD